MNIDIYVFVFWFVCDRNVCVYEISYNVNIEACAEARVSLILRLNTLYKSQHILTDL